LRGDDSFFKIFCGQRDIIGTVGQVRFISI
jgi:hypothetical protein